MSVTGRAKLAASVAGMALMIMHAPALAAGQPAPQGEAGPSPTLPPSESAPAVPETAQSEDAFGEIVITAQRRNESLQDVPIAATVLTGDMLESKGVQGITALQYAAPSLVVGDYGSANVLNIRGIGRSAVDIELPSGVVIYRDGVPTFPGYFQNEPYYDIASIEVLKGPQGTFVGKSAAGGAIFIRTAAPDLTRFGGRVELEYGNYDQYGGTAIINAPLSDEFGVRVAYRHFERNEILGDSLTGNFTGRPGRPNLDSIRFGALWKPSSKLTAQVRLDLSDLNFGGNLTSSFGAPLYDYVQNANFAYRDRSARLVGDIKYTFDSGHVLSSVTGYQYTKTINNFDRNGADAAIDMFDSAGDFTLYSQEINLISPDDADHPFSYVLGVFAQRTDTEIYDWRRKGFNITLGPNTAFPSIGLDTPYVKREDELSAFIHAKYKLSPQWTIEAGVRYSNYDNKNHIDIVAGDGTSAPTIPIYSDDPKYNQSDVDGKIAITFQPNRNHNIYAIISRGHVTGGFNIVGGSFFDKMMIYNYEAGWKATWAGGKIRTQTAAYYQTFSNYQAQFINALNPQFNNLQNAEGTSKVWGFEASLQARFGPLEFDAGVSFLDSKLGTYPDVINPVTLLPETITGQKTPFAPSFSANFGASYRIEAGKWTVTPRVDISHQSKSSGALFILPQTRIPSRTLINAGLRVGYDKYYADFWVTNLTDKRYVAGIQNQGGIWYPGAPRQYGVRIGMEF